MCPSGGKLEVRVRDPRIVRDASDVQVTSRTDFATADPATEHRELLHRVPRGRHDRRIYMEAMAKLEHGMIAGPDKNTYVEPTIWTIEWAQNFYQYPPTRSN
jgi:hypothetical protein